jgi:hypothetical protein
LLLVQLVKPPLWSRAEFASSQFWRLLQVFQFFLTYYKDGDSDRSFLYPILFLSKTETGKYTSCLYKTAMIYISSHHIK